MEKNVTTPQGLIDWIDRQSTVPLVFAEADQGDVLQTEPRPLLELVLGLRGVFTLESGGLRRVVRPGDVAWVNAHHGNHADLAATKARYGCLSLDVGGLPEFRRLGSRPVLEVMRGPSLDWTRQAVGEAVRWHRAPVDPIRAPMLKAALIRLLGNLTTVAGETAASRPAQLTRALEFMELESGDAALTIETVTRVAGASHSTLRRMFLAHLKMTPIKYLQNLRLGRARDLLAKTTLGVKEVAARVGYADALYFSKAFSRRHGCPPSALARSRGQAVRSSR